MNTPDTEILFKLKLAMITLEHIATCAGCEGCQGLAKETLEHLKEGVDFRAAV